jgi:hypothetical protein
VQVLQQWPAQFYILLGVSAANITMFDKDGVPSETEQIYPITT